MAVSQFHPRETFVRRYCMSTCLDRDVTDFEYFSCWDLGKTATRRHPKATNAKDDWPRSLLSFIVARSWQSEHYLGRCKQPQRPVFSNVQDYILVDPSPSLPRRLMEKAMSGFVSRVLCQGLQRNPADGHLSLHDDCSPPPLRSTRMSNETDDLVAAEMNLPPPFCLI